MTEATNNGFTACDMATAAAQGFRDGVASVRPAAAVVPGWLLSESAFFDQLYAASPRYLESLRLELLARLNPAPVEQSAMVVPEGWKLVPVEPNHAMHLAGETQWENSGNEAPCASSMYRAMLAAAPTPEPASPWISVEDRLPRDGQLVIASGFIFGKRENGRWVEPAIYGDDAEFHPPTQDGSGEMVADFDCEMNCTTHWMPLPAAPEQPAKEQPQ